MQKRSIFCSFFIGSLFSLFLFSCKKENQITSDPSVKLILSTESVMFDTVFSTVGSTTKMFYIKNPSSSKIVVSSIRMAEGDASSFSMNVDGVPGNSISDVEIAGNDSIFIFVKVTVDPQNSNSPMVIRDSILFDINTNQQQVKLTAWGQDAHYIVADKVFQGSLKYKIVVGENKDTTWVNDKPYLIYGYAVIDSKGHLNIDPGCRLHFFNNSGMWVYRDGSLHVNGTLAEPVTFQGSRLEPAYGESPGQWDRILINEGSKDNVINYAIIKNGFIGIQAETDSADMGNRLLLNNTIIRNMSGLGMLTRYYHIICGNTVFANCGAYAVSLTTGGTYDFRHCTIGNYWSYTARQTPSLVVTNYYLDQANGVQYAGNLDSAYFGNCIIYGLNEEELLHDSVTGAQFNYKFENCLLKTKTNINTLNFVNCVANEDPMFRDKSVNDYRLSTGSAAIDIGKDSIIIYSNVLNLLDDLKGDPRLVNPPADLGAYDYRP
jgi:hypothetical protein